MLLKRIQSLVPVRNVEVPNWFERKQSEVTRNVINVRSVAPQIILEQNGYGNIAKRGELRARHEPLFGWEIVRWRSIVVTEVAGRTRRASILILFLIAAVSLPACAPSSNKTEATGSDPVP